MKTLNYIMSVALGVFSIFQMFYLAETDLGFIGGFVILIASVVFLLFGLIEEKNEEISELRSIIKSYEKTLMIGE